MDFLLPFIDDKTVVRRVKPIVKSPQQQQQQQQPSTTVTLVKKQDQEETIYTAPTNTITYNVVATSSKDSSAQEIKGESDIQQFYSGVKIIGEDYITTYQNGEQLIYQTASSAADEQQQIQHQECLQQEQHDQQQQECLQQESPNKSSMETTIIPIPNMSNVFSSNNPSEVNTKSKKNNLKYLLNEFF